MALAPPGVELVRRLRAGHGEAGAAADVARPFPVAFVDANPALQGRLIDGLPVAAPDAIGELVAERHIRQMLVALPGVSHAERRRVIASLEPYPLHVRLLPDVQAVVSGEEAPTLRDVDVVDLIERDPVAPMPKLLAGCVTDRAVLVTGAGGSIGSELCGKCSRFRRACWCSWTSPNSGCSTFIGSLSPAPTRQSWGSGGRRARLGW